MSAFSDVAGPFPARVNSADPFLPIIFRVTGRQRENADTVTLDLEAARGATQFSFVPGQFNMLYVHGKGEIPISISGDPAIEYRITHTVRNVGAVSAGLCELDKGNSVGLRGPFGTGWPLEQARGRDVLLIAGGIGLAPLRPALYHILNHRAEYGRVALLYGARNPAERIFVPQQQQWSKRRDLDFRVTLDRGDDKWRGHVGVVTTLIDGLPFDSERAIAMVCGPEVMMRFTLKSLEARGMTRDRVYVSVERNMKCGVGFCGHCQFAHEFVCLNGPVFPVSRIERLLSIREV